MWFTDSSHEQDRPADRQRNVSHRDQLLGPAVRRDADRDHLKWRRQPLVHRPRQQRDRRAQPHQRDTFSDRVHDTHRLEQPGCDHRRFRRERLVRREERRQHRQDHAVRDDHASTRSRPAQASPSGSRAARRRRCGSAESATARPKIGRITTAGVASQGWISTTQYGYNPYGAPIERQPSGYGASTRAPARPRRPAEDVIRRSPPQDRLEASPPRAIATRERSLWTRCPYYSGDGTQLQREIGPQHDDRSIPGSTTAPQRDRTRGDDLHLQLRHTDPNGSRLLPANSRQRAERRRTLRARHRNPTRRDASSAITGGNAHSNWWPLTSLPAATNDVDDDRDRQLPTTYDRDPALQAKATWAGPSAKRCRSPATRPGSGHRQPQLDKHHVLRPARPGSQSKRSSPTTRARPGLTETA